MCNCIKGIYSNYYNSAKGVELYSAKGGIYRHLFSLPFRLSKRYFADKYIKVVQQAEIPAHSTEDSSNIIISLTSFPQRISIVHIVIKSLLLQDSDFNKIILWLSKDQFPQLEADLPNDLLSLKCEKFDIRFVDDDLKAHKKYYYAFREFRDYYVVTVDDDLCYPPDLLSRLIAISKNYPYSVCANVIRIIASEGGSYSKYRLWSKVQLSHQNDSIKYVAIGYGGVMYPPHIADSFDFDVNSIKSLCYYADDLWLKGNEMNIGLTVASGGDYFPHPVVIKGTVASGLQKSNMGKRDLNDEQWANVVAHFNIDSIV